MLIANNFYQNHPKTKRQMIWGQLDNMKRQLFIKYEYKKIFLKSIKKNKYATYKMRYQAAYLMSLQSKWSYTTLIQKRCVLSGRVWYVNKQTNLTRFVLRNQLYASNLPGFSRASW